jgi:hypothetical protein
MTGKVATFVNITNYCIFILENYIILSNQCPTVLLHTQAHLISLVKTEGEEVVVEEGKVVWGNVEIGIGKTNKHGVVDNWVVDTLENVSTGLVSLSHTLTGNLEWGVGDVQLRDPSDESGSSGLVGDGGNV